MWLQEEELGTMEGMGKNKVRTQVAAQALFKMYETHDVLRVRIIKLKDLGTHYEDLPMQYTKIFLQH